MMTHNFVSCRIMTHHFVSCKIMTHNFDSSEKNGTISIAGKNSDSQLWACTPWERRATFGFNRRAKSTVRALSTTRGFCFKYIDICMQFKSPAIDSQKDVCIELTIEYLLEPFYVKAVVGLPRDVSKLWFLELFCRKAWDSQPRHARPVDLIFYKIFIPPFCPDPPPAAPYWFAPWCLLKRSSSERQFYDDALETQERNDNSDREKDPTTLRGGPPNIYVYTHYIIYIYIYIYVYIYK